MSSSSEINTILLLNNAIVQINRYFGIFIFPFGTLGNILNILVLSQRTLRKNPCTWYFLMGSIASLVAFFSGLTTRFLSGWNLDYSDTNRYICKIRGLFALSFITLNFWLITFATIDRWLSSNIEIYYRQKSTLKNARKNTIIIIILSIGVNISILYCYEANLVDTPIKCYNKSTECRLINDLTLAVISILLPILLMSLFGIKTILNIHQSHRRINNQPTNTNEQQIQRKKIDRQLLIMLFIQVILLTILSVPLPIQRLYSTFTDTDSPPILQQTIENFIFNLFLLFIYIANGISYYIYTIGGGNIFRKGLLNVFQMFRQKILCQ